MAVIVASVTYLTCITGMAWAAAPDASGDGGNHGNHTGQDGGGSHGRGGGDGGGHHGGGHGGHGGEHGGEGGHGGGSHGGGDTSAPSAVSAPSTGTPSGSGGAYSGFAQANGKGPIEDLRACTAPPTPGAGLVSYVAKADGSFRYGGYEFAVPDFVQCMKDKGYKLDTAGRNEMTNFGSR